ncbi:MAG: hypothetical protein ACRDUV_25745 [Pseudonocardiaceae bacterium]
MPVHAGQATQQAHAHLLQRAVVQVMAALVAGRLHVGDQPCCGRGQRAEWHVEERGLL